MIGKIMLGIALAAGPVQAQSGVLLGLSNGRTLWIAPDAGGTLRVLQRDGDVVVPRRDGFWRIGFAYADPPPRARDSAAAAPGWGDMCGDEECRDQDGIMLYAVPIAAPAPPYRLNEEERDVLRSADISLNLELTYVGPRYLSLLRHSEANAGGMLSYSHTGVLLDLDTLARSAHRPLTGPWPEADPFGFDSAATERIAGRCRRQYGDAEDVGIVVDDLEMMAYRTPYIAHERGRWRLLWQYSISSGVARGFAWACDTGVEPAAQVGAHDRLPLTWETIAREVPGARDAVASPGGDMIVVMTDLDVRVFRARAGGLTRPTLTLPEPSARIIMAEWATGGNVARWTAELSGFMQPYRPREP